VNSEWRNLNGVHQTLIINYLLIERRRCLPQLFAALLYKPLDARLLMRMYLCAIEVKCKDWKVDAKGRKEKGAVEQHISEH
jgi:hypothetical protein